MPLILGTNSIKDTGYNVDNSLRFDGSSDYLRKTFSGTSTNSKKCTMSFWSKRTAIGENNRFLTANIGGSASRDSLYFTAANEIEFFLDNATDGNLRTNRLFRDPSAWYHVVVAIDTTQATASDRIKLYVNGVQETSFAASSYPSLNYDLTGFGNNVEHTIGADDSDGGSNEYYNGYMAEAVFVNGLALDATSFGEFDEDSGIWKPIDVSGLTFGTNGFYLDFEDSSALGNDVSGNNNDFTVNNLTAIDQSTDTCTNNFCTLNPLTISGATLSEGNLKYTHTQNGEYRTVLGTFGLNSGKWYWEVKIVSEDGFRPVSGIASTEDLPYYQPAYNTQHLGKGNASAGLFTHGDMQLNGSSGSPTPATLDDGDITGFALDLDSGTNTLAVYKNGTLDQTYNLTTVGTYGSYTPAITGYHSANNVMEINFGNPSFSISSGNTDGNGYGNFEYAVPSGYYALNTKNLAEYG